MDKNTKFCAVNTKIAAMSGKLLNDQDYKTMITLKTPSDIAMYLKTNTSYKNVFENMDASNMHREDIERGLKQGLVSYLDKIMHYFDGQYREFFEIFYIRYEISDLKKLARAIHIDKDYAHLQNMLFFAGRYRYINIEEILKSKSIEDLIRNLEGTIYYPYIKSLIEGKPEESLYRFEMSLDRAYFTILEDKLKNIDKKDQKVFMNLYGASIDMIDIQWIYRAKKFYHLSSEEVFSYTVDRGNVLNNKRIKKLCYTQNLDELQNIIVNTPYSFMFKGDESQDIFMERRMNRYMYFRLTKSRKKSTKDIAAVLAYLDLVEFEIKDIISIIENVRYGMEYEEAKKYLIKALN